MGYGAFGGGMWGLNLNRVACRKNCEGVIMIAVIIYDEYYYRQTRRCQDPYATILNAHHNLSLFVLQCLTIKCQVSCSVPNAAVRRTEISYNVRVITLSIYSCPDKIASVAFVLLALESYNGEIESAHPNQHTLSWGPNCNQISSPTPS